MLGALAKADDRHVGALACGRRRDLSHRDRARDDLVPETLDGVREEPEPIEMLVRDEYAQAIVRDHRELPVQVLQTRPALKPCCRSPRARPSFGVKKGHAERLPATPSRCSRRLSPSNVWLLTVPTGRSRRTAISFCV